MKHFWEWIFPIIILVGAGLTAYDIYPINKWFFLIGNGGLAIMCIIWKRWSLVALNSILTLIYLSGIIVK
jgi:hypothetical protein